MAAPQIWLRSAIEAAAGCEAHPLMTPEGLAPPYVVYTRTGTAREQLVADTLDDPAPGTMLPPVASIGVDIYVDDYVAVWETADAVVGAIHGFAGVYDDTTIESCLVLDQADGDPVMLDGRDTPTYVVTLTVEIRWS
jgi:hypothetical protein